MDCAEVVGERFFAQSIDDQALHAAFRLSGLLRLRRLQVIKAAAGMAVQHEKCRILAFQRIQAVQQSDVLGDVGKIACVIDVAVIHAALCRLKPSARQSLPCAAPFKWAVLRPSTSLKGES